MASLQKLGLSEAALVNGDEETPVILFVKDNSFSDESYAISPGDGYLDVRASSVAGAAQAFSSLLQTVEIKDDKATWPHLPITDHRST